MKKEKNMKNKRSILGLTVAFLCMNGITYSPLSHAQSEHVGGGGDVVVLPDDTVVLADPFIKRSGVNFDLNPLLIEELKRVGKLYDISHANGSNFINQVLDPLVEYRFLSELPSNCHRITVGDLPSGSFDTQIACTSGSITWINEALFRKMTIREQVKLIIHERLRANPTPVSDEQIADIVIGTEEILNVYNQELNGVLPKLNGDQVFKLNKLQMRLIQAGISTRNFCEPKSGCADKLKDYETHALGGAFLQKGIDENTYVSIDSIIGLDVTIGKNVFIKNSIVGSGSISDNTKITDSKALYSLNVGANSIINNSQVGRIIAGDKTTINDVTANELTVGNFSNINSVHFNAGEIQTGDEATITNLRQGANGGDKISAFNKVVIENVRINGLEMQAGSQIKNFDCSGNCTLRLGTNSVVSNMIVKFKENRDRDGSSDFKLSLGENSTFSNLTLNNADPREYTMPAAVGITEGLLSVTIVGILVYKATDDYERVQKGLDVPKNITFDFKGDSLCNTGRFYINGRIPVNSMAKMYRMCRAK